MQATSRDLKEEEDPARIGCLGSSTTSSSSSCSDISSSSSGNSSENINNNDSENESSIVNDPRHCTTGRHCRRQRQPRAVRRRRSTWSNRSSVLFTTIVNVLKQYLPRWWLALMHAGALAACVVTATGAAIINPGIISDGTNGAPEIADVSFYLYQQSEVINGQVHITSFSDDAQVFGPEQTCMITIAYSALALACAAGFCHLLLMIVFVFPSSSSSFSSAISFSPYPASSPLPSNVDRVSTAKSGERKKDIDEKDLYEEEGEEEETRRLAKPKSPSSTAAIAGTTTTTHQKKYPPRGGGDEWGAGERQRQQDHQKHSSSSSVWWWYALTAPTILFPLIFIALIFYIWLDGNVCSSTSDDNNNNNNNNNGGNTAGMASIELSAYSTGFIPGPGFRAVFIAWLLSLACSRLGIGLVSLQQQQ